MISFFTDTDRRYRATEKLLHAEEEYLQILFSAKELYARPLAHNYPEFHDVIFKPLADLACDSVEFCQRVSHFHQITKQNASIKAMHHSGHVTKFLPYPAFFVTAFDHKELRLELNIWEITSEALRKVCIPLKLRNYNNFFSKINVFVIKKS